MLFFITAYHDCFKHFVCCTPTSSLPIMSTITSHHPAPLKSLCVAITYHTQRCLPSHRIALHRFTHVVHLASQSSVGESTTSPAESGRDAECFTALLDVITKYHRFGYWPGSFGYCTYVFIWTTSSSLSLSTNVVLFRAIYVSSYFYRENRNNYACVQLSA